MWRLSDERHYLESLINGTVYIGPGGRDFPWADHERILRNYIRSARRRIAWETYVEGGEELIRMAQDAADRIAGGGR